MNVNSLSGELKGFMFEDMLNSNGCKN